MREDIQAAQTAYAARPVAVYWRDSHYAGEHRFHTLPDAFAYIDERWATIRCRVKHERHNASNLRQSYLEAPGLGRVSLRYVLLANDVSSY